MKTGFRITTSDPLARKTEFGFVDKKGYGILVDDGCWLTDDRVREVDR
jgi:hypothetical protein